MRGEQSVAVDIEPGVYTTTEAHRLAGISTRQMWHWMSVDVISPSAQKATGPGSYNLWTFEDVEVFAILGEVARLGAPTDYLAHMVADLRGILRDRSGLRSPEMVVVTRDPLNVVAGRSAQVSTIIAQHPSTGYWVVDLRRLLPTPPG